MNQRAHKTEEERFFTKVEKTESCWLWTGHVNPKGYGKFSRYRETPVMAHRWSYMFYVGTVPEGMVLDHLCGVKNCVRPDHLEPVTNKENLRRGRVGEKNAEHHRKKTHCRNGHKYTKSNTITQHRKTRGVVVRKCKKCYDENRKRNSDKRP